MSASVPPITRNAGMLVATTPTIEGRRVVAYHGMVTGEVILGANLFKDFFAGIRDVVGGRAGSYEIELRKAREMAIEEMIAGAAARGANAIIGVDIDYETLGSRGGMMMVTVSGTAVTLA